MERKLFNPLTRTHTKGVEYCISQEIINYLWSMIDDLSMIKKIDYLQIFYFKIKRNNLVIEHRQEVPRYRKKYTFTHLNEVYRYRGLKVYIIDDYDYSIMMLSSEY